MPPGGPATLPAGRSRAPARLRRCDGRRRMEAVTAGAALPQEPGRPRFRGRLHQAAFFVSIPAGVAAVAVAATAAARAAAVVYALSLVGLYGTSAAYHRLAHRSSRAQVRWRRLDHAMIYVAIAGTATPVGLLALDGARRVGLLVAVWAGALAGVVLKASGKARLVGPANASYLVLGWATAAVLPQLLRGLGRPAASLLLLGGALYTVGLAVLATRRPDPAPAVFGYHEVWHAFVVAASTCHYAVVLRVVGSA